MLFIPDGVPEKPMKPRKRTKFHKDGRRKHRHYAAKIFYQDGEMFTRVYTDREKAASFAARQRKSPVVRMVRVTEVD